MELAPNARERAAQRRLEDATVSQSPRAAELLDRNGV